METQYSHGSLYSSSQPLDNHRSSITAQGPQASSQTLPPLSTHSLPFAYHNDSDHQIPGIQLGPGPVEICPAYSNGTHSMAQYCSSQHPFNQFQRPLLLPQPYNSHSLSTETYQPYKSSINNQGRLPAICPMPDNPKEYSSPLFAHWQSLSSPSRLQTGHNSRPTYVVGLQGRRCNLPCEDQVAAPTDGNTRSQNCVRIPTKDETGKYPCTSCAKTYLHAKHLKRHMLRHTGTRPYSCGLCNDTFSRSDILKRHFSKCSVRRGNPTGEHHLSHSRATKKSRLEAAAKARACEETNNLPCKRPKGATEIESNSPNGAFDLSALKLGASGCSDESQPVSSCASRSGSVKVSSGNYGGSGSSSSYDPIAYVYSGGQITPESVTTSGAVTPFHYLQETRPSQFLPSDISFNENIHGSGVDPNSRTPTGSAYPIGSLPQILESGNGRGTDTGWPPLFHSNTLEGYGNPQFDGHQLPKPETDTAQAHQTLEPKLDFRDLHFPLPHGYTPYMPAKV